MVIPTLLPDCITAKQFIKVLKRQPWKKDVTNAEFSKDNGLILLCSEVSLYKNVTSWWSYCLFWKLWLLEVLMKPMPGQVCQYNASVSKGKLSSARYAQGKGMIQDWKSFISNGETASLLPFQMENFYWNIFSQTARQIIFLWHINMSKGEKWATGHSVLLWKLAKKMFSNDGFSSLLGFLAFQCNSRPEFMVLILTKLLNWWKY